MAKINTPAPTPAEIDDEVLYKVQMSKTVKVGRAWLRPGALDLVLKGKVVKEVIDGIAEYHPVAD